MSIVWEEVMRVTIPGQPVPKGRPRFQMRRGKPRVYTDGKTLAFERLVALCVSSSTATRGAPRPMCGELGPVRLDIQAIFQRPIGMNRLKDSGDLLPHVKRPDLDNVVKSVMDGIGKAGDLIFRDDGQVQCIRAESWYAEKGQGPRTELVIYRQAR